MGDDLPIFGFDEEFRTCADDLEFQAVDVEEVWGGVDSTEMGVDVEGVEGSWAGESLGGNGLDDVTLGDVVLEGCDVLLVAFAANVGGVFMVQLDWGLGWERDIGGGKGANDVLDSCAGGFVDAGKLFVFGRNVEVGHDLDGLVEMVECDNGIEKHEQALGKLEGVFEGTSGTRFEVSYTVVSDVANSTAGHCW